jgi:L-ascorbate metabolism protein UlaG (beta-lactamase superfamily)
MDIVWYGYSCFRIVERGMASVVTDPYEPSLGLPELKLKADIVTVSRDAAAHNYLKGVKGNRITVSGPGEFEVGGVFITGIPMLDKSKDGNGAKNILYTFNFDNLAIAHLGDLSFVPSQSQIENLGTVDVAMVPVGGGRALNAAKAAEVISLIEPSIVLPMQYKTNGETMKLTMVNRFLSEMGVSKPEPLPNLKLTKSSLSEETQVIVLEPAV